MNKYTHVDIDLRPYQPTKYSSILQTLSVVFILAMLAILFYNGLS